jgi:hypothetical protein
MWQPAGAAAAALVATACVVGAERPASRLDEARAPLEPRSPVMAVARPTTAGCAAIRPERRPPRPPGPPADVVWVDGDCRFDGVHYAWRAGRWQARTAPYSWR